MWYPSTSTTDVTDLVTLDEAKAQVRVDTSNTDNDDYLNALISGARSFVEKSCGIMIGSRTVVAKCDTPDDLARLPDAPTTAITSIQYVDVDGNTQTVDTSVYEARLDGLEGGIVLKYGQVWPTQQVGSRLTVTSVVGYDDLTKDAALSHAMKLLIGDWFESRETMEEGRVAMLPYGVDALLTNYKRNA